MIFGILLAAGMSTRMGQPKQLLQWSGQPLIRYVAERALASQINGLVVVLGAEAASTRAALRGLSGPVQTVENLEYRVGQALSLRAGLQALPKAAHAALIFLVDQPLVGPEIINQVITAYNADQSVAAVAPYYHGRRGHPVLLSRRLFEELEQLTGDVGAREILEKYADQVRRVEVNDPAILSDMDTPEAYQALSGKQM